MCYDLLFEKTFKKEHLRLIYIQKMFLLANSMSNSNKIWDLSLLMVLLDAKEDW